MKTCFNKTLTVVAIIMGLASCSMAPEYKRPAMPVESNWPQGEAYKAALPQTTDGGALSESISTLTWHQFFRSTQLQTIINTALDNNRDLRVAILNIEAARAQYRIQRADQLPSVNAALETSRSAIPENSSSILGGDTQTNSALSVGLSAFEIDLFGRVRSLSQAAMQEYLATEEAQSAARISLIAEIANAYLMYLADRKLLELTEDTLTTQQESLALIQKRFDLGVGTQQDVAQAATSVETARANKALYTRLVAQDKNAIILLAGANVPDELLDSATLDTVSVMDTLPVALPSDVLQARPDIRAAEHRLMAANANIGAARAALFPRLSLTSAIGLASGALGNLVDRDSATAWNVSPQVTAPIFQAGRLRAGVEAARAGEKITLAQYEGAIQTAFREVADELAARGTLTDQLNAQNALISATQKAYDIAKARYQQGVDNYLGVLDAQRELYSAQQQGIAVQRARLNNLVNLFRSLGGGQGA